MSIEHDMNVKITDMYDKFEMKPAKKDNSLAEPVSGAKPCIRSMNDASADIVRELDWTIGCIAVNTKNKDGKRWILKTIEAGGVQLVNENDEDDICVAPIEEFQLKQWRRVKQVVVETIPDGTPDPLDTAEYTSSMIKSFAFFAFHEQANSSDNTDKLKIMMKPSRMVVATENIAKGKLVMAPVAFTFKLTDPHASAPPVVYTNSLMFLGQVKVGPKVQWLYAQGVASSMPKDTTPGCKSFFWTVKPTSKEADANVAFTVSLSNHKFQAPAIESWLCNNAQAKSVIKVPLMKSTKRIGAGEELLVYVPKASSKHAEKDETHDDDDDDDEDEPAPKKKAKKN